MTEAAPAPVVVDDANKRAEILEKTRGGKLVKGGQKIDENLFDSVKAAYTNVVYNPVLIIFYILGISILLFNSPAGGGPLETLANHFNATAHTSSMPVKAMFASTMYNFCDFLIDYKISFALFILWFTPAALKPSSYVVSFAFIAGIVFYSLPSPSVFIAIVCSQAFFLYTQLRKPIFKFFIVMGVAFVIMSTFTLSTRDLNDRIMATLKKIAGNMDTISIRNISTSHETDGSYLYFTLHADSETSGAIWAGVTTTVAAGTKWEYRVPFDEFSRWYKVVSTTDLYAPGRPTLTDLNRYMYDVSKDAYVSPDNVRAKREATVNYNVVYPTFAPPASTSTPAAGTGQQATPAPTPAPAPVVPPVNIPNRPSTPPASPKIPPSPQSPNKN